MSRERLPACGGLVTFESALALPIHARFRAHSCNQPAASSRPIQVGRQEGQSYDGLLTDNFAFSPDSRRLAYAAKAGSKWLAVIDCKAAEI